MALTKKAQQLLAIALPIIIIVAIVSMIRTAKRPKGLAFSYTAYAVDESDGKTYFFRYNSPLKWPATYQGRTLWPLYRCYECGNTFVAHVGSESTRCPSCGSSSTWDYGPETGESIEAEEIDLEDIEFPPKN